MASVGLSTASKDDVPDSPAAGVTAAPTSSPPARSGAWAKDHCDFLLDSIDAQLSQLQAQGPTTKFKGEDDDGTASLVGISRAADLGGCSEKGNGEPPPAEDSSSPTEEDTGPQTRCLDLEVNRADQSRSDSVCTEELAAKFQATLVDLLLSSDSDGEEDAFALAVAPRNTRLLQRRTESPGPSQPLADSETALDSTKKRGRAPSFQGVSRWKWDQDSLIPRPGEPPSPCARHRKRSLESLGEKISWLSQKDSDESAGATDTLGDNPPWKKELQPRGPLNVGELERSAAVSGGKAFREPQRRSKSFEASSEWVRDPPENSSSPLLVGDLDSSPPLEIDVVPVGVWDREGPARTGRPCAPKKGQADGPDGLLGATCLRALPGYRAPSGAEGRGRLIPPGWRSSLTACRTGGMQRAALSRLGRKANGASVPRASQTSLVFTSMEPRKNRATPAAHPEGHGEILESVACPGCSTEVSRSPCRDLLRFLGPRDGGMEEEELARLRSGGSCRISSPAKQVPSRADNPTWKATLLGAYTDCEERPSRECRGGLFTKDLGLQEEKIAPKMGQISRADVSLHAILQQKKHLALELEALWDALDEGRKEAGRLELHLEESRSQVDETRANLVLLECEREASRRELQALRKELAVRRQRGSRYGAAQAEVSRLVTEREELKSHVRLLEDRLSFLKLQLRSSKAELASVKEMADQTKQLQEAVLSEKEVELSRLRKMVSALEAEKEAQSRAVERLKEEKENQLEALQQEKTSRLQEWLQREEEQALREEQKKWEADIRAALQRQCEALQEQNQRRQSDLQEDLEGKRKSNRALRETTASLHRRIQELESQVQVFQVEKKAATEEVQARLQKEKAEALKQVREELEQERDQARAKMQQMEENQRSLQSELNKRGSRAHNGWAEPSLAREVALACRQLQDLLPKKSGGPLLPQMLHGSAAQLPSSRLLQALQETCRCIQRYLQDLNQEIEIQRHEILHIQQEKECGLRQQKEQLHLENQLPLEALKEQLVQEHMEDVVALQRSWLMEAGVKEGLRSCQHLQEKDGGLGATEMSPVCWRDQLVREFEEDLNAELEKRLSRDQPMPFRRELEMPEPEAQPATVGNCFHPHPCCSRWLNATAVFPSQPPVATPNQLCRLQSRVRELRAENAACCEVGLDSLGGFWENLAETYSHERPWAAGISSSLACGSSSWK